MASTNDTQLLEALSAYIADIKPYHTKLIEMSTTFQFSDSFIATFAERTAWNIYLQNVWSKSDVGGWQLYNFSGGTQSDATYVIPATIFPRFSLNDSLNAEQLPLGTDPASVDLTDDNNDGIPDSEEPWSGMPGYASHQLGSNVTPVSAKLVTLVRNVDTITSISDYSVSFTYDLAIEIDDEWLTLGFQDSVPIFLVGGETFNGEVTVISSTQFLLSSVDQFVPSGTYTITADAGQFYTNVQAIVNSGGDASLIIGAYANQFVPMPAVSVVFTQTGRYAVPFHQGSRVRLNGVQMEFGVEYVVDSSRGFIQFTPGRFPLPTDHIDINTFISDKLYFKYVTPFVGSTDPTQPRDSFIITINSTQPDGYDIVFNNSNGATGKGEIFDLTLPSNAEDGEVFTITALTPTYFQVQQTAPFTGPISYASFGVEYAGVQGTQPQVMLDGEYELNGSFTLGSLPSPITFTIDGSWVDYYLTQDSNSYGTININVPALTQPYELDPTDYLPDLSIQTQRGYIQTPYDPLAALHAGMQFSTFGQVMVNSVPTQTGTGLEYQFIFNEIPPVNTYIEFRIEQAGQYNTVTNTSMIESVMFTELLSFYDCMCSASIPSGVGWYYVNPGMTGFDLSYAAQPNSMWPQLPMATITGTPASLPGVVEKLRLFDPVCFDNSNTGYEAIPYDMDRFETDSCAGIGTDLNGNNVFTYCNDDLYISVATGQQWAASTAYIIDDQVNINGAVYACVTAGTSGAVAPAWPANPTINVTTVDDGSVVWEYTSVSAQDIVHNVMLHPSANYFSEPENTNRLVLYYQGVNEVSEVQVYDGGHLITPDAVTIDARLIIITFFTARQYSVLLTISDTPIDNPSMGTLKLDGAWKLDGLQQLNGMLV